MRRRGSDCCGLAAGREVVTSGDSKFWVFFGGIWLLVGLGFFVTSLIALFFAEPAASDDPALLWVFLAVGLAVASAGAFIIRRALVIAARDKRLMRSGIQVTATVTDLRRSPVTINRQERWHVHYRYEYTAGRTLEGRSPALPSDAVIGFRPGDEVLVKVDPRQPEESLFVGVAP